MKHYPEGVVPQGAYHLIKGQIPMMWLTAYDGSVVFDLMGGASIPDRTKPESVQLMSGGLSGLVPPWQTIDQKGATQDGVTFIDALYDPIEVTAKVLCVGRDRKNLRTVVRDLIASIDAKKASRLNFFTFDAGHWWSDVRWFKTAPDANLVGAKFRYPLTLVLRADDGFWRTHDNVDMFRFSYENMSDAFAFKAGSQSATTLGNWPLKYYDGTGGGYVAANGSSVAWIDDPNKPFNTQARSVAIGPYRNFSTAGDTQVMSIEIGSMQDWKISSRAENHIWVRMGRNPDGTWNGDGVRVSILPGLNRLSYFRNFVETRMRETMKAAPPLPGEKFTLVAGFNGEPRRFQLQRNGLPILDHVESGTGSPLGAAWRGVGFGMRAGAALVGQATPSSVRRVAAGDNSAVSQTGYLTRVNAGDQPMFDSYTVFGPGKFKFWMGPEAEPDNFVEFGPLLPNQVVHIVTDPRKRVVQDMTSVPPTPQELTVFQKALSGLLSFAGGSDVPLFRAIGSNFGITPPQGNMYSLLSGRFSSACAIPAKSPGEPAKEHYVKVSIENGSAASMIIASGTPRRRYPL